MKQSIVFTFWAVLLSSISCLGQIYIGKNGSIRFTSDAPLELINAHSDAASGVMDCSKNEFIFTVKLTTFKGFNSPLQQEHFNEDYLESTLYPTATFKGKIIELGTIDLQRNTTYTVRTKGILEIHGVKQERIIKCNMKIEGDVILVEALFDVALNDHNIRVPKIVNQKISEVIKAKVSFKLNKQV